MFRIKVEEKKESIFFAIALGCVLLLALGATVIYWIQPGAREVVPMRESRSAAASEDPIEERRGRVGGERDAAETKAVSSARPLSTKSGDDDSLWFFGTLICALLVLFGLTFRYYSHREMKEAERRWQRATRNFLARMEVERANSADEKFGSDTLWWRILKNEDVEVTEGDRLAVVEPRET